MRNISKCQAISGNMVWYDQVPINSIDMCWKYIYYSATQHFIYIYIIYIREVPCEMNIT